MVGDFLSFSQQDLGSSRLAIAEPFDAPAWHLSNVNHLSNLQSFSVPHTLGDPCRQPIYSSSLSLPRIHFDSSIAITVLFNIADTLQCNDRNQQSVTTVTNKRYNIIHNKYVSVIIDVV